ncbi:MAG: hypothetical protein ABI277_09765 [Burkholderiaceae bacterium]
MTTDASNSDQSFIREIESYLGRTMTPFEVSLAISLKNDKTAPMIARELEGTIIADPNKIRPEHSDTAKE